jgi:hypothetical protein
MSDIIIGPDQTEMLLTYEVTDEALETAAEADQRLSSRSITALISHFSAPTARTNNFGRPPE